jgi:acetyl-CoA synthetase
VRALAEIDTPIDAAFIAVNRHATLGIVADLARRGAGGAVCFASGFSEAVAEDESGADIQAQLVAAAGEMPVLGPNCYGFVNALDRAAIWPDQHGMTPVDRGVAILTQSSNIAINLTMQRRAVPIAMMITCGNQAQTSQAEMVSALLDDDRITAIGLHIEGFGDIANWHRAAQKAAAKGVPLVALKSGRSDQAQQATLSHTASLAGSDAGAQALLDRLGIARVFDLPGFLETLKLLHHVGRLDSNQISCISCSGGEASLAADTAFGCDLVVPPLTEVQKTDLRAALGPMVALANPLDYHTYIWRDTQAMTATWAAMAAEHVGITCSIVDYPHTDASDWACATDAALAVRQQTGRPFAVVATLPELMPQDVASRLAMAGVAPMLGLPECFTAIEIASKTADLEPDLPLPSGVDIPDAVLIDEAQAKADLARGGVPVPLSRISKKEEVDLTGLTGPFAVKGMGLAHKTEMGAVKLGVQADDVPDVAASMPGDQVLVEEMVTGAIAELLIGVVRDPAHGFCLTIGAGGVLTELMRDTTTVLVPTSRNGVRRALGRLRVFPLLTGYRGKPATDMDALLETIMAVQDYVVAHARDLQEVEINPLIVTADRAVAADALIRRRENNRD